MSEKRIEIFPIFNYLILFGLLTSGATLYAPVIMPAVFNFEGSYSWLTSISSVIAYLLGCIALFLFFLMVILSVIRKKIIITKVCFINACLSIVGFVSTFFV